MNRRSKAFIIIIILELHQISVASPLHHTIVTIKTCCHLFVVTVYSTGTHAKIKSLKHGHPCFSNFDSSMDAEAKLLQHGQFGLTTVPVVPWEGAPLPRAPNQMPFLPRCFGM